MTDDIGRGEADGCDAANALQPRDRIGQARASRLGQVDLLEHPFVRGHHGIQVVVAKVEAKKTIEKQATVDGTETVLLVAPASLC